MKYDEMVYPCFQCRQLTRAQHTGIPKSLAMFPMLIFRLVFVVDLLISLICLLTSRSKYLESSAGVVCRVCWYSCMLTENM